MLENADCAIVVLGDQDKASPFGEVLFFMLIPHPLNKHLIIFYAS